MKMSIFTCLLMFISSTLCAEDENNNGSKILGKWKLVQVQYNDQPPTPAALDQIGIIEITPDGDCKGWHQYQTNPPSPIKALNGTWQLKGSRFYLTPQKKTTRQLSHLQFDSGLMVLTTLSKEGPVAFYYKRMRVDLPANTIEDIEKDFIISFPNSWEVYTQYNYSVLTTELQDGFVKLRLNAIALSLADDDTINGVIHLSVSSRKLVDELELRPDDPLHSATLRKQMINGREWRIEYAVSEEVKNVISCQASTYLQGSTIRLFFTLDPSVIKDADKFVTGVLSTFKPL